MSNVNRRDLVLELESAGGRDGPEPRRRLASGPAGPGQARGVVKSLEPSTVADRRVSHWENFFRDHQSFGAAWSRRDPGGNAGL